MNKKERTKEIPRVIVPQGAQKRIASHFGVSGETVRKVEKPLNFDPFGHAELSLLAKI